MSIRVLLVDDQDLMREGLCAILSANDDIEVVAEASSGPLAVAAARALGPDVVLMDVEMPGGDGLTATRDVLAGCPGTRVLMLTMFDLDEYVLTALRAGASGFLLKTTPAAALVASVRACAAGDLPFSTTVTRRLVESFVHQPSAMPPGTLPEACRDLTDRELDVLRALARGLSNAEIGHELFLAETTVKTHVTRVLGKLGLRDRLQAVVFAYESELVRLGSRGPASFTPRSSSGGVPEEATLHRPLGARVDSEHGG
ncbi:two component transcriptional regulator, LuxR family [Modestobacter sp. DSM 44400]|uniref:response regulator n=1 Tax=Modestobacter sp. DSM 44400 TaxID=1550230 RepID=UPI0008987384|nr:two component transcriptional regulator, LuxR family [Modestobacter sp. DSM 44400]